jgi:hypothetical protein
MKTLALLAAAAAIALVCGCAEPDPNLSRDCNKITNVYDMNVCFYNKSVSKLSSAACTDIMNETMKAECISQVAVRLLDYMPCKQQDKAAKKDACEARVSDARKKAREANPGIKLP